MIQFFCPGCQTPLKSRENLAGRRIACMACGERVEVPDRSQSIPAATKKREGPGSRRAHAEPEEMWAQLPRSARVHGDRLGDPLVYCKAKRVRQFIIVAIAAGLGALGIYAFNYAFPGNWDFGGHYFFLLMPLGCLWAWYRAAVRIFDVIVVFNKGMLHRRLGRWRTIRWRDVERVRQDVTEHHSGKHLTYTSHFYTIDLRDGRYFDINDDFTNVDRLGKIMTEETTRLLLPGAIDAFNDGEAIDFGKIALDRRGLWHGNTLYLWNAFESVKIDAGYLVVKLTEDRFKGSVRSSDIVNIGVFMALVDSVLQAR